MDTEQTEEHIPQTRAELLELIKQARAPLEQSISDLSEAQQLLPGPGGWSVKDQLAHITAWERGMVALLQHQPRYIAMGLDPAEIEQIEINELNEMIRQRSRQRSLAEVRDDFERTHQELLAVLAGLSDADLFKTYGYYQPDEPGEDSGDPIINWIIGNTYEHYQEHLPLIKAIGE